MATLLLIPVVKGYQRYQLKRSNSSTERIPKAKRGRKSITSLVIPSITSTHFPVLEETNEESTSAQCEEEFSAFSPTYSAPIPPYKIRAPSRTPPTAPNEANENTVSPLQYDEKDFGDCPKYTAPRPPSNISPPARAPPQPPVMLGINLCESPSTPPVELYGEASSYFNVTPRIELPGDSPVDDFSSNSEIYELHGDEEFSEPLSPLPLHVVKRSSSPLIPDLTFSSDENEDEKEEYGHIPIGVSHLQVPEMEDESLDMEPPPIPPKSPARKLRVASNRTDLWL